MNWTWWSAMGALYGGLAVAFGAFGAHALRGRVEERLLEVFETGVRYQMYHALALLCLGFIATRIDATWIRISGWGFVLGVLIFSGSLYTLVFSGIRVFGAITPIGGVLLIASWLILAWNLFRLSA